MEIFFTVIFDVVYAIQLFAVSLSLVIIFFPYNYSIKKWYWTLLSLALCYAITFLYSMTFTSLLSQIKNNVLSGFSFTIAYLASFITIFFLLPKENKSTQAALLFTYLAITVVVTEFAAQFMRMLVYYTDGENFDYISILSYILLVICAILMRKFTLRDFDNVTTLSVSLIYIVDILAIVCVRTYTAYYTTNEIRVSNYSVLVTFGSLYVIDFATYYLIYQVIKERNKIAFNERAALAQTLDNKIMNISKQSYEDIREIKHDIKNQLMSLGYLVKEKKYDELEEYYKELMHSVEFSLYRIDTGNDAFNAVINLESSKDRSQNVKFNTNLIVPKTTPLSSSDVCALISNACDNAIEYLIKSNLPKKELNLNIIPRGEYLFISVTNPVEENQKITDLKTSKVDTKNHGQGHIIISKIAEKYNGYSSFSIEDNTFNCEIMIDLHYEGK